MAGKLQLPLEGGDGRNWEADVAKGEEAGQGLRPGPEDSTQGDQKQHHKLDLRWVPEKDKEVEPTGSPLPVVHHVQEPFLPPLPKDNAKEHLGLSASEVVLIESLTPQENLTAITIPPDIGCARKSPPDPEGYYLCDEIAFLFTGSSGILGYFPCYRTYAELPSYRPARHPSKIRTVKERAKASPEPTPSALCPAPAPAAEPHPAPSCLRFESLTCWVRKIFRKSAEPEPEPQPSTSSDPGQRQKDSRAQLCLAQRGSSRRVHPEPPSIKTSTPIS